MQPRELPPEPAPQPDEGTLPAPVELPEPYPPDELDRPAPPDPGPDRDDGALEQPTSSVLPELSRRT